MIGIIAIRSHLYLPSFCNSFLLEHCLWLSGSVSACLDFSTEAFWQLSLNHQSSPVEMSRWLSYPGKTAHDAQWAKCLTWQLITTPTGLIKSRRFALLIQMCLWSNEWSGLSVLAHYLDTEPALRCGRLFSSDKTGMLYVRCHFKAHSAKKVMLLFEYLVSLTFGDVCENVHE